MRRLSLFSGPERLGRDVPAGTLEAVLAGLGQALGVPVEALGVMSTRERTFSSIRFCRASLTDGRTREVVVKIYRPWMHCDAAAQRELLLRDWEINTYLHQCLAGQTRFRVPQPLFHSPEHLTIVTEFVPGAQLQAKLEKLARWLPGKAAVKELERDCRACGEWLRHFQQVTRAKTGGEADILQMRKLVADRLEWSTDAAHIPIDASQRQTILSYFDAVARDLVPADLWSSRVHGDFFAGNVIVSPDYVAGLDFGTQRQDSVYRDPTYFLFQLETLGEQPQFRRAVVKQLCDAFLDGYEPGLSREAFLSRPMARLFQVFHQAMRLGRMLVKDGPILKRLNNRRMAAHAVSALCGLAVHAP